MLVEVIWALAVVVLAFAGAALLISVILAVLKQRGLDCSNSFERVFKACMLGLASFIRAILRGR